MKKFVAMLVLATLSGLVYVYAEVEAVKIGYTIRKQEEMKTMLIDRARTLKYNIGRLKSPANLERKLQAQKISLESPKSWRTLTLDSGKKPIVQPDLIQTLWNRPGIFAKLFVGTAEAQAKESSN